MQSASKPPTIPEEPILLTEPQQNRVLVFTCSIVSANGWSNNDIDKSQVLETHPETFFVAVFALLSLPGVGLTLRELPKVPRNGL